MSTVVQSARQSRAESETIPKRQKQQFAAIAFLPTVLFGAAMVIDALLREQGDPDSPASVIILVVAAIAFSVIGVWQARKHINRRNDLSADKRRQWNVGLLWGPITVPLVWGKLIRPLPEQPSDAPLADEPYPVDLGLGNTFDALTDMAPRWYLTFCVVFGIAFAVFIAIVWNPIAAVIPVIGVLAALSMRKRQGAKRSASDA